MGIETKEKIRREKTTLRVSLKQVDTEERKSQRKHKKISPIKRRLRKIERVSRMEEGCYKYKRKAG